MRIVLSLAMLLIIAYLCTAFTVFNKKPVGRLCTDIEVTTKDTTFSDLITSRSVGDILKQAKLNPSHLTDCRCIKDCFYPFRIRHSFPRKANPYLRMFSAGIPRERRSVS